MLRAVVVAALVAGAPLASASEIDPLCERVLSPVEAEALVGVKPLALVGPSKAKLATGTCNYATPNGDGERKLVFLVSVSHGTTAKDFEQLRGVAIKPRKAEGIGDQAFTAVGVVGFRKGKTLVSLGSFVDQKTGRHRIAEAKLVEVAKVLAGRI